VTHYHAGIQKLAADLIDGRQCGYDGDPFEEFSVTHQLKRVLKGAVETSAAGDLIGLAFTGFDGIPEFGDEEETEKKEIVIGTKKQKKKKGH
jgi:hypothetical protein